MKNNPEVAATLWDVSVAGAKLDQAKAARWPTLTYEGNYTKYLNSRPLFEARYNGQTRIFSKQQSVGSVLLKLPLFTGGRIINEIKAAELFRLAEQTGSPGPGMSWSSTSPAPSTPSSARKK